jgi:NAD(P)-dependent dehydrogenase (short-subunit alcohol dehydrogenase family)
MGLLRKAALFAALVAAISFLASLAADGRGRLYYPRAGFRLEDLPRLHGKVALVTGANVGIGFATAEELARAGATVFVAARDGAKSAEAVSKLQARVPSGKFKALKEGLELSSFASVRKYAAAFARENTRLNVLVNNAGVMMNPYGLTKDGFESQHGINHLGHYLLTLELMPLLEAGQPSRVVSVSSAAHTAAPSDVGIPFATLNDKESYSPVTAYGISKLCNVLFAEELSRRVGDKKIFVNSCHPGGVDTELQRHVVDFASKFIPRSWAVWLRDVLAGLIMLTPTEGALTQLYLAASPEVEARNIRGAYYVPIARVPNSPWDLAIGASRFVGDKALAKRLWEYSAKATGADYPPKPMALPAA